MFFLKMVMLSRKHQFGRTHHLLNALAGQLCIIEPDNPVGQFYSPARRMVSRMASGWPAWKAAASVTTQAR